MGDVNQTLLLCRVATRLCALPIEHVVETMRPLPMDGMPGTARFVLGACIVRGSPVPVVDAATLLGTSEAHPSRLVIVKADRRRFALAVRSVIGVRAIPRESLHGLAPLLHDAGSAVITAMGTLEAELLLVLQSARVVPDSVWDALESEPAYR